MKGALQMNGFDGQNLKRLGNQIAVAIEPDADGYVGRECPVADCLGYFKITFGTGVKGPAPCYCPYCGHKGESNTFFTQEQIDYAQSVALRVLLRTLFPRSTPSDAKFALRRHPKFRFKTSLLLDDAFRMHSL